MLSLLFISVSFLAVMGQSNPHPRPDVIRQCEFGSALIPGTGRPRVCAPFVPVGQIECPDMGTFCAGGPADEPGLCCLQNNPCSIGRPRTINGNAFPCRGPEARPCDPGYMCVPNKSPLSAVCCPAFLPGGGCPPGVPIVNCLVDPCQVTTCPLIPYAMCRSNYCGGCIAEFFLYGMNVTKFCRRRSYY